MMSTQMFFPSVFDLDQLYQATSDSSTIDSWCLDPSSVYWNGQDFSRCARLRYLIGEPALVVIALLVASYALPFLLNWCDRRLRPTIHGSCLNEHVHPGPLSIHEVNNLPQDATEDSNLNGPQAVSRAEDRIIATEVLREGGLGVDEQSRKRLMSGRDGSASLADEYADGCPSSESYMAASAKSWKDFTTTLCTIGLLSCAIARYFAETIAERQAGSNWLLFPVLLWLAASVMAFKKLLIALQSHIQNKKHPGPAYLQLEFRLIPIYLICLPFEVLDNRSVWLRYLAHQHTGESLRRLVIIRFLAAVMLAVILGIEMCSPRPTTLLPAHQKAKQQPTASTSDPQPSQQRPPALEPRRSLISLAYFMYTDSYLWKHTFATATEQSIPDLRVDDKAAPVLFRWKHDQAEYQRVGIRPSFLRALCWHFRNQLLGQQVFAYFNAVGALLPPFFLQRILGFISAKSTENAEPMQVAFLYAFGMLCTQVFLTFSQSASLVIGRRLSVRMRALLISLIFTKGLRRTDTAPKTCGSTSPADRSTEGEPKAASEEAEGRASIGKIANLVSNDVFSLSEIGAYLHFLWPESVIQLVLAGLYLYKLLGYSALAGMFCIVVAVPIQSYLTRLWARYQELLMGAADRRLGLASEVINCIKCVKFFAWEQNFMEKMAALREAELRMLFKRLMITIAESAVAFSVPVLVSIVTFYVHTKVLGKDLTAAEVFTALALFNVFRFPMSILVAMISGLLQSYVSLKRIERFLNEDETEKYSTLSVPRPEEGDPMVGFRHASFTYDARKEENNPSFETGTFKLTGLDFEFPPGKLSLVIGRVGSGKTTLLLSLLGETNKLSGNAFLPSPVSREWGLNPEVKLTDTTAYAPQQPWLLSDTIRKNILYGSLMNETRYTQVLKACALNPDLATFTDSDLTEIGDKGTVLSGGQKARISLARALYSPAKVLLLDDILSAVDSHTAQHLFKEVLTGPLMKNRTVILVTHAVELCMPGAAFMVSLDRGKVVFAGKPSLSKSGSVLFNSEGDAESSKDESELTIEDLADTQSDQGPQAQIKIGEATQRLVEDEYQAVGAVSSTIYKLYYDALGGLMPIALTLVLFSLAEACNVLSTWILRQWADTHPESEPIRQSNWSWLNPSIVTYTHLSRDAPDLISLNQNSASLDVQGRDEVLNYYVQLYLLAGLATLAFQLARMVFFTWRSIIAGRDIYERLINTLLHAKIRFFDTVPMGRVLNRLSKDVQTMDRDLAENLINMANDILGAIAILAVVIVVLPVGFLVAAMGACLLYVAIGYIYLSSTREIKRAESKNRSPVISLVGECLGGVTSIRAYGDIARYTQQMFHLIDDYNRPFFMLWLCNRWLSSRIDMAAAFFTFGVIAYMISSDMSAALSGFALSYVISFNIKTLWIVRWWSVNEINLNCLERIHEYLDIDREPTSGVKPSAAWPSKQGTIEVEGLTARYAPHLPPVLKSVSFSVKPGEKIGICGRTGSGKSTLALSFFRFIEAEAGRIVIDGLDISKLDLRSLRSRLTIIPQESVLFAATIRWNMDPFSEHDDSQIWDALRRVGMAASMTDTHSAGSSSMQESLTLNSTERKISFIKSLDMEVRDGGRNFSTGQRQLLAIARAILKLQSSAILILDESTASLDAESDEQIQSTIRAEMEGATILCIAHRLKTIIDYDKVLVLSAGEVVEFDSPWSLLEKDGSTFKQLCERSGHFEELKQMAKKVSKE